MTRYGWDASNHDWSRGPMNLAQARREGISLFTHKASEGTTFTDPFFAQAMSRAQAADFPVVGAYHVLWPNNPVGQADFFVSVIQRYAPWWRQHPCFIAQTDSELFQEFKPYRQPTLAEQHAFSDRVAAQLGIIPTRIPDYAPEWLYGNTLRGLRYPLWASAYGGNPAGPFAQHAARDDDPRWGAYSGITPTILQCGSNATIAGQAPCDINVIRVATDADLQRLFLGQPTEDEVTPEQIDAVASAAAAKVNAHTDSILGYLWGGLSVGDNSTFKGGISLPDVAAQLAALQSAVGQLGAGGSIDYSKVQAAAEAALAKLRVEVGQ